MSANTRWRQITRVPVLIYKVQSTYVRYILRTGIKCTGRYFAKLGQGRRRRRLGILLGRVQRTTVGVATALTPRAWGRDGHSYDNVRRRRDGQTSATTFGRRLRKFRGGPDRRWFAAYFGNEHPGSLLHSDCPTWIPELKLIYLLCRTHHSLGRDELLKFHSLSKLMWRV